MIRKIKDSRRRSVVCCLIPRYDVGPLVLSKLCSREDVMYVDVWNHFSNDRSLFSRNGLHLNRVGKARLGRVLDESVKYESIRNKAKLPQPVQTSREAVIGEPNEVSTIVSQTDGQVEFRPLPVDRGTETGNQEVARSDAVDFLKRV